MTCTRRTWSPPGTRLRGRLRPIWLLAFILAATAEAAAGPVAVDDDAGRRIALEQPARRVIALYAALSDVVCALGKEDSLVARTRSETEPPAVAALPCIGTHMRPSVEMAVGLKPDVILQMGARARTSEAVAAIERLGVPVAMFQARDFGELFSVIRRVGALLGAGDRARELVGSMQSRLDRVARLVEGRRRPRVFFEVRYPNLLAAGRGSMVSAVIRRAGGVNCVDSHRKLARLNEEELLRLDPDVYVLQQGPMNPDPTPPSGRPHFRGLRAVQAGRVLQVEERLYSRPGPDSVQAVEELAGFLHPEIPSPEAKP